MITVQQVEAMGRGDTLTFGNKKIVRLHSKQWVCYEDNGKKEAGYMFHEAARVVAWAKDDDDE